MLFKCSIIEHFVILQHKVVPVVTYVIAATVTGSLSPESIALLFTSFIYRITVLGKDQDVSQVRLFFAVSVVFENGDSLLGAEDCGKDSVSAPLLKHVLTENIATF